MFIHIHSIIKKIEINIYLNEPCSISINLEGWMRNSAFIEYGIVFDSNSMISIGEIRNLSSGSQRARMISGDVISPSLYNYLGKMLLIS